MDRITKDDILGIRAGQTKSWALPNNFACNSARTMVQYVKRMCMPKNIKNYTTTVDWETNIITIKAISR